MTHKSDFDSLIINVKKQIQLRPVEVSEKTDFWNMLQEDLGEDGGRVFAAPKDSDGSYAYPYFDRYWQEPGRMPFYITDDGRVAGFVLIRKLGDDLYSIAEFYIRPEMRRNSIGKSAMNKVFEAFPERSWLISVIRQNERAYHFWLHVAEHSSAPIELEIIEKRRFRWPEHH